MGCKYRVMDKCRAKDNIEDAFCFGKDGCPYYENEVEAIPKDQYENRLKADMVAILTEIKLKITEKSYYDTTIIGDYEDEVRIDLVELDDVNDIIQQKINELKENEDQYGTISN